MYNRGAYNRMAYNRNAVPPNVFRSRHFELELSMQTAFGRQISLRSDDISLQLGRDRASPNRIKLFFSQPMSAATEYSSAGYRLIKTFVRNPIQLNTSMATDTPRLRMRPTSEPRILQPEMLQSRLGLLHMPQNTYSMLLKLEGAPGIEWAFTSNDRLLYLSYSAENTTFTTLTALADVRIHPGETLVIDSDPDQFTVYLNGVNALECYSGAWFRIAPDTQRVQVVFEGGAAHVQIEYTEMWI